MTGLQIFLLILGILIVITIIIIVILVAVGYFGTQQINKTLQGNFSFRPLSNSSQHVTSSSAGGVTGATGPNIGDTLVLSSSTSVPCADYSWVLSNNFLQLGGLNATVIPSGPTGATGPVDNSSIVLSGVTGATDLNQWVFKDDLLRWCLKNKQDFCMKNSNGTVVLGQTSFSSITQPEFGWVPEAAIKSPLCM